MLWRSSLPGRSALRPSCPWRWRRRRKVGEYHIEYRREGVVVMYPWSKPLGGGTVYVVVQKK